MALALQTWTLVHSQQRSFLELRSHNQSKVKEAAKTAAQAIFGPSGAAGSSSSSRLVFGEYLQK